MKWIFLFLFTGCCPALSQAQKIRTLVPSAPVAAGVAFQVQFVVTGATDVQVTQPPSCDSCRLVSGPYQYKGTLREDGKSLPVENITYTLLPLLPGKRTVRGITVATKAGGVLKSRDVPLIVVASAKTTPGPTAAQTVVSLYAPAQASRLRPWINQNVFLLATLNKNTCYLGEPVVATFKLYARLSASSELVKSPGFYGFSMLEMSTVAERAGHVETLNGITYNTSVLRRVQLYPELAGRLTIEGMHVENTVEYADSLHPSEKQTVQTESVSAPMAVLVRPLPEKKPETFSGAVGSFRLSLRLLDSLLPLNRRGTLVLTLTGAGNFLQFTAPPVKWPQGIEALDSVVRDRVNNQLAPLAGTRTVVYHFTADTAGAVSLAPIAFSFFNTQLGTYETVASDSITFHVVSAARVQKPESVEHTGKKWYVWAALAFLLVAALVFALRRARKAKPLPGNKVVPQAPAPSFTERLQALDTNSMSDRQVCLQLQHLLTEARSSMKRPLSPDEKDEYERLQHDCSLVVYSNLRLPTGTKALKERTLHLLATLQT
jgi:hypothetical protein